MDYTLRRLTNTDQPILWAMLRHAAHEPSIAAVQSQACLVRYAADWGRTGDLGMVAVMSCEVVGAAWVRLWQGEDRGFGYLDATIPELAMAVLPDYRGKGIGEDLLRTLLDTAKSHYPAICLNVRETNPAIRLYQRVGFVKLDGSEVTNRTGGVSFNMICPLHEF